MGTDDSNKAAIRIEGGSNIRVEDNVSVGFDEGVSASNVDRLEVKGNSAFARDTMRSPVETRSLIKRFIMNPWTITVGGGLVVIAIGAWLFSS